MLAESIRHPSIKVYLSAVRSLHIEQGWPDPLSNCLQLQRVLKGIKRVQGANASATRLPVTPEVLCIVQAGLDLSSFDDCMLWAACTLAYFGFLRSAEFTVASLAAFDPSIHLTVQDIAVDSAKMPSCLQIHIKASKTDPFRQGCHVFVGLGSSSLCAVRAVLTYLARRGNRPGPLFIHANGRPLTRQLLTDRLRSILQSAGVVGNYSSHSFRIGAATMAAKRGIPDHLIQVLGRWKSDAYKLYVKTPPETIVSASSKLA